MDGMMAILDRVLFELGEAQRAGIHGLARRRTTEEMRWAQNVDEATHSLTGSVIGPDCQYDWTGSGPEHDEKGNLITRELPDKKSHPKVLLKMLDNCMALAEKANKAEAAWEKDPESRERECLQ